MGARGTYAVFVLRDFTRGEAAEAELRTNSCDLFSRFMVQYMNTRHTHCELRDCFLTFLLELHLRIY